jgi:MFS transporter, MHS family, shikimate and dehydroshikimate transport protein
LGKQPEARPNSHVKVATASLIGTAIEWYDFFLYGSAASALVLNPPADCPVKWGAR